MMPLQVLFSKSPRATNHGHRRNGAALATWLLIVFHGSVCMGQTRDLDEDGRWVATKGGTLRRSEAPEPMEGRTGVFCEVDETKKGYVYFRVAPPQPDLTGFAKLRFRMYGGLETARVVQVYVTDMEWRHQMWLSPILHERSQQKRWTEFEVYLDVPTRDMGGDMRNSQWITWRVHVPSGGEGSKGFYLDGVRLEGASALSKMGLEDVSLTHKGYKAVFSASEGLELVHFVTPKGKRIPVRTATAVMPLATVPADTTVVRLGSETQWKAVEPSKDKLHVEYVKGDFHLENTYRWEDDALAVRRRITCLRVGEGYHGSRFHMVEFDSPLDRCTYDHGQQTSAGALPFEKMLDLPGNWIAGHTTDGLGAVAIFPRRPLYMYRAEKRQFVLLDRGNFVRIPLEPGISIETTVWIAPLVGQSPESGAAAAAKSLCAHLAKKGDPARTFFMPTHQPHRRTDRTLARGERFAVWQSSPSQTVPLQSPPPTQTGNVIRLDMARGEVEPIHLAMHAIGKLGRVSASCGPLSGSDGVVSADQFNVRYPVHVHLRRTTEAERESVAEPEQAAFVAEIPNGMAFMETDRFYGAKARSLGYIEDPIFSSPADEVQPGRNHPIWITLRVPKDTKPGLYRGYVSVREDDRERARMPLEVNVWAFELPRVTSLRTWYQLWRWPPVRKQWREYYRNLAEHKVSGFGSMPASPKVTLVNGKVEADWTAFDAAAKYLFDELGLRNAKLPHGKRGGGHHHVYPFLGFKEGTPEYEKALHGFMRQAREHLMARGWLGGLDCYVFDEPDHERIAVVRRTTAVIRGAIPEIRVFPACARNMGTLAGVLNAWCPPVDYFGQPAGNFSTKRIAEGRARGDVYWWYNQSDNCIGAPIVTHRALPWANWQAGVIGYFVWTINCWGNKGMQWGTVFEIGEAMAIYPGKEGPVDSLRWEQTREGLEDYDYLVMLGRALDRPNVPAELARRGRAALGQARSLMPDPRRQIGVDPGKLLEVRDEIGAILHQLTAQSGG